MVNCASKREKYDVVFLDPPRAGTTPAFVNSCRKLSPRKIVYVSCNPETLTRDIPLFMENGYKPISAAPVDMFPWTDSIEVVALFERDENYKVKQIIKSYGKSSRKQKHSVK